YIGLSKWTYKENLKKKNSQPPQPGTLAFYAALFNSVELNATHYSIPEAEKLNKWYNAVDRADFHFCPKFYKGITHQGPVGLAKMGLTKDFMNRMREFKEKLGVSFIQLPHEQLPRQENIMTFLKLLPRDFSCAVSFTNEAWFTEPTRLTTFVGELHDINIGTIITDSPGRRDAVHMQLSTATAFIRFNCQGDEALDIFRVGEWKKQIKSWFLQGLEKCYFFLHIHNKDAEEDFINFVQYEFKF
ncbi:MAG: DUF72 domain-containing protein, partial [Ferruginibacter sp.]